MKRWIHASIDYDEMLQLASTSNDPKVLARLANSSEGYAIREAVAQNPNITPDIVQSIMDNPKNKDYNYGNNGNIYYMLAKNPAVTKSQLKELAKNYGYSTELGVVNNPNLDSELAEFILEECPISALVVLLAYSEDKAFITPAFLEEAYDKINENQNIEDQFNNFTLRYFINHNNCPIDILEDIYNKIVTYMQSSYPKHRSVAESYFEGLLANPTFAKAHPEIKLTDIDFSEPKKKKTRWDKEIWRNLSPEDSEFYDLSSTYLHPIEDNVLDSLGLELDISAVETDGDVFIYDKDSGEELADTDYYTFAETELMLAEKSATSKQYASNFKKYIQNLIK